MTLVEIARSCLNIDVEVNELIKKYQELQEKLKEKELYIAELEEKLKEKED